MTAMAAETYEEQEKRRRQFARYFAYGPREPMEPMATRAEVLGIPCANCDAEAGEECRTAFPRPSFLGRTFPGLRGVHTRRYLDRTGDPR